MRRVVRSDDLDLTVQQRLPQPAIVVRCLQRWIHLHERSEAIVIADIEEQMMRARLGRNQVAVVTKDFNFVAGRDMQNMESTLMPMC